MSHSSATKQKVLVADDDRTTRHAITRMLRDANYAVTAAKDGIDALRKVQQTEFDLVFLDIWMPGMSGLEVLACIRSGKSHPKVITMTSDTTPQSLLRAVREQAYEYITKRSGQGSCRVGTASARRRVFAANRSGVGSSAMGRIADTVHARRGRANSSLSAQTGGRPARRLASWNRHGFS